MSGSVARALAIGLAALAGFVDALGFIAVGGFYVAFMSGNSTLMSVGMAAGAEHRIEIAAGLVASFVVGVLLGTLIGRLMGPRRAAGVLLVVAMLLALAVLMHKAGIGEGAVLMMALAMGAENTVFQKDGQTGIGLTYMTGTLVRLGQKLAEAITGGPWRAVLPDTLLWSGMLIGAFLGATAYRHLGFDGLWIAVAAATVLAAVGRIGAKAA